MDQIDLHSSYFPPDIGALTSEWGNGAQIGETSGISEMDKVFMWMRGFVSAWYGWANDGKGTFFDFMATAKAKRDRWKFCLYKQEDMNSFKSSDGVHMTANDIYNNLIWTYTGITPYKHFSEKYKQPQLDLATYHEAVEWVEKHFFVIYPKDRKYNNVMDNFRFYHDKFGIDCFLVDPFKALILDGDERGDYVMTKAFIQAKEFALETNSSFNFISHAKSMTEQKEKDGRYKVVNQFMQLGGSAWDINMDSQYSIYRPERHLDPNDPKVHFFNLKQRKAEIVGANRGVYEKIEFDFMKKRFYFDGICPIDGSLSKKAMKNTHQGAVNFSEPVTPFVKRSDDDMPF